MNTAPRTVMARMRAAIETCRSDRRGAGMIEYLILVGAVTLVGIAGFTWLGRSSFRKAHQQAIEISGLETPDAVVEQPITRSAGTLREPDAKDGRPGLEPDGEDGRPELDLSGAWGIGLVSCVCAALAFALFVRSRQPVRDALAAAAPEDDGHGGNQRLAPCGCGDVESGASLESGGGRGLGTSDVDACADGQPITEPRKQIE